MQTIADAVVQLLAWLRAFIGAWWLSLLLLPVAFFLRTRIRVRLIEPRRTAAYVSIAVLALIAAATHTAIVGDPAPPWYTDDYGYALSADTFAHGRLTNPPHPMRAYFDTLYILQTPTYNSMYQSAPGLLAAAGEMLFHRRVVMLWIAAAAAAMAVCWAAEAVVPIGIAWLAGLIVAIHPVLLTWLNHYHAAPLNALAGSLAIGGALRASSGRRWPAVAMGAGIAILANIRPYEGFVVAVIAVVLARRFVPLAMGIALLGLAWTAYYDRSVTGDPLLLPYNAYNARYLSAPNFIFQGPFHQHDYPTKEMERRYRIFRHYYERSRNVRDFIVSAGQRLKELLAMGIPAVPKPSAANSLQLIAALPLAFAVFRQQAIAAALLAFVAAILIITWWPQMHYLAPAAGLFAIVYCLGVSEMIHRRLDVFALFAVGACALLAVWAYVGVLRAPRPTATRTQVNNALNRRAGGHLVLVDPDCEDLTFNAANIDASRIVWANMTGDLRPLLDYYRDREVWSVRCGPVSSLTFVRPAIAAPAHGYVGDPY